MYFKLTYKADKIALAKKVSDHFSIKFFVCFTVCSPFNITSYNYIICFPFGAREKKECGFLDIVYLSLFSVGL